MNKARAIASAAAALGVAAPALAHHSRSNFDLESVVEIEGVVTEFTWANPHAFAVVETTGGDRAAEEWTFELNSTPVLKRFGWSADTLEVGDRVVARGNPDRSPDRRFVYANVFVRNGEEIWAWGGPQGTRAPQIAAQGSTDFTGVWRIEFRGDVLGRNSPDDRELVTTLPLTAKGRAQVDAFDAADNPAWDCAPESLPAIVGHPYPFEIVRDAEDRLLIRYELNKLERVVHLGMDGHPERLEPTPLGHSIGRFEDGELVIHTAGFAHVRWGNGRGVDAGTQKTTIERYRLSEDGTELSLALTMRDPEYLSEPVTVGHDYALLADYALQDYVCDPEISRRHLTAGEEN